jgi:hypothetical protein
VDHYVLAIAGGTVGTRTWKAGYVYQWTGVRWEEREPTQYTELYISCFKDGLDVLSLTQNMGWFGAVFAGFIAAQKAFIEELESQIIKLKTGGVIYGGDKYLPNGEPNPNAAASAKGFWLGANGQAKLEGANVSGHIVAGSGSFEKGTFTDVTIIGNSNIGGNSVVNGTIRGTLDGKNLVTSGSVTAGTAFVLKSKNDGFFLGGSGGVYADIATVPVKILRTIATGTCTLKILFPRVANNSGRFKVVTKSGNVINEVQTLMSTSIHQIRNSREQDDYQYTINLGSGGTSVELYMEYQSSNMGVVFFLNTTFELTCNENPGLLALLG